MSTFKKLSKKAKTTIIVFFVIFVVIFFLSWMTPGKSFILSIEFGVIVGGLAACTVYLCGD